ncbi:hypothetical protein OK074_7145 [Actinobacteria bacterium OK074]|nr:hypothetical protein OK074_7145 [Actinobacteria bacterium OK074]
MYAYDVSRRAPYQLPPQSLPPLRAGRELGGGGSGTPIYDRLYAEWVRSFRALPGDRSGEEQTGFAPFGPPPQYPAGAQPYPGAYVPAPAYSSYGALSAFSAGAHGARHGNGMHHLLPAALPPGPRRGY